jgi:predicted nucleic acid-binding protein
MFVLDTNILSAFAPGRAEREASVASAWLIANGYGVFLSVVTIAEIRAGIEKLKRRGGHGKASALEEWLATIEVSYGSRILPIDLRVAHEIGRLTDISMASGPRGEFTDIAIAATAKIHDLGVATRNMRHFKPLGIDCVDPFEGKLG